LLTTLTTHHLYYAWKVAERFPWSAILLETEIPKAPFDTFHSFEKQRDDYERETLLKEGPAGFEDVSATQRLPDLSSREGVEVLRNIAPEVIIVFGTGRLAPEVFGSAALGCLNLHGGNPEHYRGLDSHLWAIYHRDFDNLVTTLHLVDAHLDTGDIVLQTQLTLSRGSRLHHLRSINTKACVEISSLALSALHSGHLPRRHQIGRGRYYSFMPSVLKEACALKFDQYVARL
jgi:methionyl-tRNA formyltransferase